MRLNMTYERFDIMRNQPETGNLELIWFFLQIDASLEIVVPLFFEEVNQICLLCFNFDYSINVIYYANRM